MISGMRYSTLLGVLFLGTALCGEVTEPETPSAKARRLAASESKADRLQAIRWLRTLARPGTTKGDEATYRYAELCLRFHREGDKTALPEAGKAFTRLAEEAGSRWGLRGKIGLLRVMALEGRRAEAIKGLDRFLGQQTKCERAVEAAFFLGGIHFRGDAELSDLRNARRAFSFALELHRAVSKYHTPLVSQKQIKDALALVKRRIWELEAGRLKVLFTRAEKLRKGRKFAAAIKIYRQIREEFPGHGTTELSGLRVAQCLSGMKRFEQAVAEARKFVARDPLGAWRGHAHLLIGDIQLEHFFNVRDSEPEFRCVLAPRKARPRWVDPLRRNLIGWRKLDPEKTPSATEAHKSWKGVLYAAHERVGILEYIRRRFEVAGDHFVSSARLKPVKGFEGDREAGMAEVAALCRKRMMPLDEALLAQGDDRTRLVLFLGSVYMKGWKDDRAMQLFERVYRNEFKKATLDQRGYARSRMGAGLQYCGKYDKAMEIYKEFGKKPLSGSMYAGDALLQRAATESKMGHPWKAMPLFEQCMARYPNTFWGEHAAYQRAFFSFCLEEPRVARDWCKRALATYPRSVWAKRCKLWIAALQKKEAEKRKAGGK